MTDHAQAVRDRRVLVLPPTPRDGATTCQMLARGGIAADTVRIDAGPGCGRCTRGAGALLLPEEAIAGGEVELLRVLAEQPPWSDLPILVMTRPGADSAYAAHAVRVLEQRHAPRASVAGGDAGQRDPHRASGARAAIPDSRAPGRARDSGRDAARRRPSQGRVPGHARPRAAKSTVAAAHQPASAQERTAGPSRSWRESWT